MTLIERLMSFVSPEPNSGCWLWMGHCDKDGYGKIQVLHSGRYAHRISYELHVGSIGKGLQLDHLCRVRSCVNPAHLQPVTCAENISRGETGIAQRSKTHCANGHAYDQVNTYFRPDGKGRDCKSCKRDNLRRFYAKRGAIA